MTAQLKPKTRYAGLRTDQEYRVIKKGYDWVCVSVKGKPLFVSKDLVDIR